ncbi:MAG: L-lactate dehydrogenase [Alphaproteobacteria bacterium]|nr:L-lactate dehydrogenase [Alphaproteobacteria bacterium]MBQ2811161.1 L-lactate dehydrogenase [Alphaproteobacteria bacterium]
MKIGIIGAGNVGSATAFALVLRGVAREVILIDKDEKKAIAEALDISHATTFAYASVVRAGTYADLTCADVVIICAGANQKPGETRIALMERNVEILKSVISQTLYYAPETIILVASNPVDIMTYYTLKISELPHNRVFGSGTILDTSRFRTLLGEHLKISSKSIHANVLGEHGDSEVLIWSNADAGTVALETLSIELNRKFNFETKATIDDNVRNAAYKIIEGKGATFYGIAGGLTRICQAIGTNENAILTVSSLHQDIEGIKDVCLSLPSIINQNGVEKVIYPKLTPEEHILLKASAEKLKDYMLF